MGSTGRGRDSIVLGYGGRWLWLSHPTTRGQSQSAPSISAVKIAKIVIIVGHPPCPILPNESHNFMTGHRKCYLRVTICLVIVHYCRGMWGFTVLWGVRSSCCHWSMSLSFRAAHHMEKTDNQVCKPPLILNLYATDRGSWNHSLYPCMQDAAVLTYAPCHDLPLPMIAVSGRQLIINGLIKPQQCNDWLFGQLITTCTNRIPNDPAYLPIVIQIYWHNQNWYQQILTCWEQC